MSIATFSAPAPAASWPACSARSRSTPARRGPASSPRPADGRNYPGCSPRRSCWRCWRSAPTLLRARSECGARRRSAVRRAADHSPRADRHDLSPVDRRIPADRCDRGCDHRAADRARRRASASRCRCCTASGARRARGSLSSSACPAPRSGGRPIRTCRASAIQPSPSSACRRRCHFSTRANFRADVLGVVRRSTPQPRLLVLEASGILEIDFTAAQILIDLVGECRADGVTVAMARLESTRAQDAFERLQVSTMSCRKT